MPMISITCPLCNKSFQRTQKHINQVTRRSGGWKCQPCSNAQTARRLEKPLGAVTRRHMGYIYEKTAEGWVQQHRVVMERHLGRKILDDEVVHHLNEIKDDNRIENLEVIPFGEHTRLHNIGSQKSEKTKERIRDGKEAGGSTKLNRALAIEVRTRFENGESQRSIARELNVSPMTISRAVRGETWRNYE